MNIKEIHDFVRQIADKDQAGYIPPEEIDRALDRASMWLFNDYRAVYGGSVDSYEALAPFKTALDYTTSGQGVYTVAGNQNYMQLLVADVAVTDGDGTRRWPVKIVKEDELPSRLSSQLLAPTATRPIGVETATGVFKIYPAQVHAGTLRFLRRPAVPVFSYTQVGRVITYDANTSVQLEWTEPYLNKVVFKAIQFLGLNLDNRLLVDAGAALPQANV